MPLYEYEVVLPDGTGGEVFEVLQGMAETPLTAHPETGEPVRRVVASWVLAPDALQADGLATALFFVPGHELAARYGVEWLTVHSDGHAEGSEYFLEGLF